MSIPKKIHYCWFGGSSLSEMAQKCIASWKRYCPDYEIIEWNEKNFDINCCDFVKEAYKSKKWAFVSDYARLKVVYDFGGVYLDTDVELLKSFNKILENSRGFFGYENEKIVASGLGFACEAHEEILLEMINCYHEMKFSENNMSEQACPIINTKILLNYGLKSNNTFQIINGICILPTDYLCPENMYTGKTTYTDNTISVHHYSGSWQTEKMRKRIKYIIFIKRLLPDSLVNFVKKLYRLFK